MKDFIRYNWWKLFIFSFVMNILVSVILCYVGYRELESDPTKMVVSEEGGKQVVTFEKAGKKVDVLGSSNEVDTNNFSNSGVHVFYYKDAIGVSVNYFQIAKYIRISLDDIHKINGQTIGDIYVDHIGNELFSAKGLYDMFFTSLVFSFVILLSLYVMINSFANGYAHHEAVRVTPSTDEKVIARAELVWHGLIVEAVTESAELKALYLALTIAMTVWNNLIVYGTVWLTIALMSVTCIIMSTILSSCTKKVREEVKKAMDRFGHS